MRWRGVSKLFTLAALLVTGCGPKPVTAPDQAAPAADPFRDVTREAGITYRLEPAKRPLRILESVGSGCGFFDYDGDGLQDLLLVGAPRCALYRNVGEGKFRDVTDQSGLSASGKWVGCATGDVDNDGDVDLFLCGYGCTSLLENRGDGTFRDITRAAGIRQTPWGTAPTFADFDRDGLLDLYVGAYVDFGPHTKQYCDLRGTGVQTSCRPFDYDPILGQCYRGKGGLRFEDVTRKWGLLNAHGRNLGAVVADFNRDGWPDLYLANDEIQADLFENQKGKGFKNVAIQTGTGYGPEGLRMGGMGVDWGDYDNDGWQDLLVGTYEAEAKPLFRNLGGSSFEAVSRKTQILAPTYPTVVWGTLLFDYDNDSWLDLLFVGGHVYDNIAKVSATSAYRQPAHLFHNDHGVFKDAASPSMAVPVSGRGAAVADYDNDGDQDLLIQDMDGAARLLRNESRPARRIQIALHGTKSNRDALGAQVVVTAGGQKRMAEVRTSRSYVSVCDPRITFGLGDATRVDRLEITWPSGAKSAFSDLPVDRLVQITEGQSDWNAAASAH